LTNPLSNTKSQESVAYHEAGHVVVASVLNFGIEDREKTLTICESGQGISHYQPTLVPGDECASTRKRIIALYAGLIAQRRFFPTCLDKYAQGDNEEIRDLVGNLYGGPDTAKAKHLLAETHRECGELVDLHFRAIKALASEVWKKPWKDTVVATPPCMQTREKWLGAKEIVEILKEFELPVNLCKAKLIRD
jgi:hypothetical protein